MNVLACSGEGTETDADVGWPMAARSGSVIAAFSPGVFTVFASVCVFSDAACVDSARGRGGNSSSSSVSVVRTMW